VTSSFAPEAVARAVELMRNGDTLRSIWRRIADEHPELTGFGVDRVLDLARQVTAEARPHA
jgi:hypothetical protein